MDHIVPEISVVMSVFNGARYLKAAVDSILSQDCLTFEFVIVDDGSTDESPEILEQYATADSRVRLLHQNNTGLTQALIRGCDVARGEFIARQDADDISLPGRLRKQADLLKSDPRLVFVSCQAQVIAPGGEVVLTHTRPITPEAATQLLVHGGTGPPGHGSVMFRAGDYQKVGGYRAEFYFAQDCDLWFRLAERGLLSYLPECLYQYRLDPRSVSGSRDAIKRAFAQAVGDCRALRESGQSEEMVLARCRNLLSRSTERSSSSEAATLYFLGRNLLTTKPLAACNYLLRSLWHQPVNPRAWTCLFLSPLMYLRSLFGDCRT